MAAGLYDGFPMIEHFSVQGATTWMIYLATGGYGFISSIKYSSNKCYVTFNATVLTIGIVDMSDLSSIQILTDPSSKGTEIGPSSVAVSADVLFYNVLDMNDGKLKLVAFNTANYGAVGINLQGTRTDHTITYH